MNELKPKEIKVVTPEPYFKLAFKCSNRAFYRVKSDVYSFAESIGIEAQDGYIGEFCDYEGNLERIEIFNYERGLPLITALLEYYEVEKSSMPDGQNLVLSIF